LLKSSSPIGALDGGISLSVDRWSDAERFRAMARCELETAQELIRAGFGLAGRHGPHHGAIGRAPECDAAGKLFDFTSGRFITASQTAGGNNALVADARAS
jgi:hypothetical protein